VVTPNDQPVRVNLTRVTRHAVDLAKQADAALDRAFVLGGSMRTRSKAVVVAAFVLAAALVGGPASGAAAGEGNGNEPPPSATIAVAGAFAATGVLTGECGAFRQVVDGGGDWSGLGTSTIHLVWCLGNDIGGNHWPVFDGTFAISAGDGSTLTGDVSGFVEAGGGGPLFPLHLTLDVTAGTGRLAGSTGSIAMEGAFGFGASTATGTVDGTITVPPHTPTSADECLDGGWQHLINAKGHPFHNENQCVHFAARNPGLVA
jgi:hypothetical protein